VEACDRPVVFERAEFEFQSLVADPPRPPGAGRGLLPELALPDRIGRRLPGREGVAFYRIYVARGEGDRLCGLYLPHVHANAVVYLNGEWLGQGGQFRSPAALNWNRPLYFMFPSSRLARDVNVIDVGVLAHGGVFAAIDKIWLGPHGELGPRHRRATLFRISVAEASSWLSVGIVALFAAFGCSLREPIYLLLALAAALHGINSLNYHLRDLPVSFWVFNTGVNAAIDLMACVLVAMVLRLLNLRARCVSYGLWSFATLVAGAALMLPGPEFERHMLLLHLPAAAFALYGLSQLFVYRARLPRLERGIYLVTACLMCFITTRDLWIQVQKQNGSVDASVIHGFPLLGPVMLLGFGSALMARFLRIYRRAEHANLELQQQIAEKHAELERNFERVREFERESVLGQERARLMSEMHDGIGGHLVAALAMIERGRSCRDDLARALREALDDMRLVIHSLQPSASDIPLMLADMRARLEPQLASQGMRFHWAVSDLPRLGLGPGQVLQVLRVVQESITNVLKHAGAQRVTVATGVSREGDVTHVYVEITDDGRGIDGHHANEGRGLPSMRARARKLGGRLSVASSVSGTSVRLSIPTTACD
jgi:signal transduction histidine kinase